MRYCSCEEPQAASMKGQPKIQPGRKGGVWWYEAGWHLTTRGVLERRQAATHRLDLAELEDRLRAGEPSGVLSRRLQEARRAVERDQKYENEDVAFEHCEEALRWRRQKLKEAGIEPPSHDGRLLDTSPKEATEV